MDMDIQRSLRIDKDAIDEELIAQPSLYYQVAMAHVNAVSLADQAKKNLDIVLATESARLRGKLEAAGEKVTEKRLEVETLTSKAYGQALQTMITHQRTASELQAAREAFTQRSFVLKDLAHIEVSRGYSSDSVGARDADYKKNRDTYAKQLKKGR